MSEQSEDFKTLIHGSNPIPTTFKDHNIKPITLQELEQLDNEHTQISVIEGSAQE